MKNSLKLFRSSVFFLCTLFLLNGCSSNENNKNKTEAVTQKPSHAVDTVVIKQMQFNPAILHVKVGDTIIWINKGMVDHDITSDKNNSFYSDTLHVGKTWKMAVKDSAGYHCSIHPTMQGRLVLK
ncbi:MAG TPA: plastocyanin/azurin family copper-binding protein [Hanamia sp.]